jgi:hypothetical protein
LAALAVQMLADTDDATAASSLIDGYGDNGIDAIQYEANSQQLFLVQSKYRLDGGRPDQAEVLKFTAGIREKGLTTRFIRNCRRWKMPLTFPN